MEKFKRLLFFAEHAGEDRVDLFHVIAEVEQVGELVGRQAGGDVGVGLQQVEQRQLAVRFPHLHRVALNQRIAVLAARARLRQREEDALRVDEAAHTVEILLHPRGVDEQRSEEHTSELQSLMRISYAVFCLKKKK